MIKIIRLYRCDAYKDEIFMKIYKHFSDEDFLGERNYMALNYKSGIKLHEKYFYRTEVMKLIPTHEIIFDRTQKNPVWKLYVKLNKEFKKQRIKVYGQIIYYLTELLLDPQFGALIREFKKDFKYEDDVYFIEYMKQIKELDFGDEGQLL